MALPNSPAGTGAFRKAQDGIQKEVSWPLMLQVNESVDVCRAKLKPLQPVPQERLEIILGQRVLVALVPIGFKFGCWSSHTVFGREDGWACSGKYGLMPSPCSLVCSSGI